MKNKTIAYWNYGIVGVTIAGSAIDANNDFYTLVACAMFAALIVSAVRLNNLPD